MSTITQSGIDAAQSGDTVLVADGIYMGSGNADLDYGGKNIAVSSLHGASTTIIDCRGSSTNPHRGFYFHSSETSVALVNGFTIKNGYSSGIYVIGSSPTITNCIFVNNVGGFGGGLFVSGNTCSVSNCLFYSNKASQGGGGIGSLAVNLLSITNCTFCNNVAAGSGGGAVYIHYANATVTNSILRGDTSSNAYGNEINGDDASFSVAHSDIQGGYTGTANFDADPLFVNAAIGDLHLQPKSSCLGAGSPNGAPSTDLDGRTRPNPPSSGAYELGRTLNVPSQYPSVQGGIDAAQTGDTVLVADGTYTGDGNRDLDFGGKIITVKSVNGKAKTTIDCQGSATDSHRGFNFHSNETAAATIDGFTIKNGVGLATEDTGNQSFGGAVIFLESNPTIRNCVFQNNSADFGGAMGGVGSVTVSNCTFLGNTSNLGGGGAISFAFDTDPGAAAAAPTVIGCTFSGNKAMQGGGGSIAENNNSLTLK